MIGVFVYIIFTFIWLETIYHVSIFGMNGVQPLFMLAFILLVAGVETLLCKLTRSRNWNLALLWLLQICNLFLYGAQVVYYEIFTRPLLLETAITTGGEAIKDFWSVALDGLGRSAGWLLLMLVPLVLMAVLLKTKKFSLEQNQKWDWLFNAASIIAGFAGIALILAWSYEEDEAFYNDYQEFYAPEEIIREYGVLPVYGRQLMFDILPAKDTQVWQGGIPVLEESEAIEDVTQSETQTEELEEIVTEPVDTVDRSPNILNIDFETLLKNGDANMDWLTLTMQNMTPSNKNEYTGMMEGYNLIYITAEGFSPYAVSEELTPTLYQMLHSGVVVEDYYIPLWTTSTSDGEYVNLFGQIPDGQHSFKRSQYNSYPYALPQYFAAEGVKSYAYHNNSLSYYDRYKTHPNLGFDFKAALRGSLSKAEWGDKVFAMEGATLWPNSDYEMMVATVSEWINEDRFFAYYMTLSGHTNYTWAGNRMAAKNQSLVEHLDCSEQMKAYIACNYEVERALTYLVEQLEQAGKLDTTLIVLSADHYPYGMKNVKAEMEAVNGTSMTNLDVQRNCLIMWNSQMETVVVEKTCSALDIVPTILNLFGFEYDSRLFAGRDMLSDSPSMVVFSNRSFITDAVIYDSQTNTVTSRTGQEISADYIEAMKEYVKVMFQYSAGILNYGFDEAVHDAQRETLELIKPDLPEVPEEQIKE